MDGLVRTLLNNLTSAGLMVLIVGLAVSLGIVSEALQARRAGRGRNNEMLHVTVQFVGLAYAILVGFVIVSLWQDQSEAREAVSSEASALQDIVSISRVLPTRDARPVRAAVGSYCRAVVEDEWKLLRTGSSSPMAERRVHEIFDAVTAIQAQVPVVTALQASMVDAVKELTARRIHRLELAEVRLAAELWLLVLLASTIVIVLVSAFEADGGWHTLTTLIVATTVGMLLFAVVALSYPFSGEVSIAADPFADVLRSAVTS